MRTLSDCAFERMQCEFAPRLGVCREELRPDTPITRFLPSERRRAVWRAIEHESGLRMPSLALPPHLGQIQEWLLLSGLVRTIVVVILLGPKWVIWPLVVATGAVTQGIFYLATRPLATELIDIETFGDLARALLARNMKKLRHEYGLKATREEIYITLRTLLIEHGADPAAITPEASLNELIGS